MVAADWQADREVQGQQTRSKIWGLNQAGQTEAEVSSSRNAESAFLLIVGARLQRLSTSNSSHTSTSMQYRAAVVLYRDLVLAQALNLTSSQSQHRRRVERQQQQQQNQQLQQTRWLSRRPKDDPSLRSSRSLQLSLFTYFRQRPSRQLHLQQLPVSKPSRNPPLPQLAQS